MRTDVLLLTIGGILWFSGGWVERIQNSCQGCHAILDRIVPLLLQRRPPFWHSFECFSDTAFL